jgi:hypothetical protein
MQRNSGEVCSEMTAPGYQQADKSLRAHRSLKIFAIAKYRDQAAWHFPSTRPGFKPASFGFRGWLRPRLLEESHSRYSISAKAARAFAKTDKIAPLMKLLSSAAGPR